MITAIPLVNPVIDRMRNELDRAAELASPMIKSTPAMSVATVSPSTPYFCTMP